MKIIALVIIIAVIVLLDKTLTAINIYQVGKNYPSKDRYSIEKNPAARFFFRSFGLIEGSIIYAILSIVTLLIVFYILQMYFSSVVSMYIIFIVYSFVIGNNTFFLLRYSGVIQ